jgi:hypothetical protein
MMRDAPITRDDIRRMARRNIAAVLLRAVSGLLIFAVILILAVASAFGGRS